MLAASKRLLIITGPQGSGNHLFSKIFALHDDVFGWKDLNKQYWIAHDKEPFAEAWHDVSKLKDVDWGGKDYAVTSISCPYAYKGVTTEPNYDNFITEAKSLGYDVSVAIIGRDQNIIKYQQQRVRYTHSYPKFSSKLESLMQHQPVFLSTELLYLYKEYYVRSLSSLVGIPVDSSRDTVNSILAVDTNEKYFAPADDQELDVTVRQVSGIIQAK